jgi:hypothetical protein
MPNVFYQSFSRLSIPPIADYDYLLVASAIEIPKAQRDRIAAFFTISYRKEIDFIPHEDLTQHREPLLS